MNKIYKFSMVIYCLCLMSSMARSQTVEGNLKDVRAKRAVLFAEPMDQVVTFPEAISPLDDVIISLASQSQTNFFCDVTDVPAETKIESFPGTQFTKQVVAKNPGKYKPTLWLQMGDLMEQSKMTNLQMAPRTILMWHPPEPLTVGREVMADWENKGRSLDSPPLKYAELSSEWKDYFKQLGWNGQFENTDIKVNLADVPVEARRRVLYEAYNRVFWSDLNLDCFDNELWPQAKLDVSNSYFVTGEPVEPSLLLAEGHLKTIETADGMERIQSIVGVPIGPISLLEKTEDNKEELSAELFKPLLLPHTDAPVVTPIRSLSTSEIKEDAGLTKAVALDFRHASLSDLLPAMSQQTGVSLRCDLSAKDGLSSRRLTVKTAGLSLSETMLALSRLTGAVWAREGEIYTLHDNHEDTLSLHLRQLGDPRYYRLRDKSIDSTKERFRRNAPLIRAIVKAIGLPALQDTQTRVPITQLPKNLQDQLRHIAQEEALLSLPVRALMERDFFGNMTDAANPFSNELVLHLRFEKKPLAIEWLPAETTSGDVLLHQPMPRSIDLSLTLRKPNNELVSLLFPGIEWVGTPTK